MFSFYFFSLYLNWPQVFVALLLQLFYGYPIEPILSIWNVNLHQNCVHDRVYIVLKRTRTFLLMFHVPTTYSLNAKCSDRTHTLPYAFEYTCEDVAFPPILLLGR